MIEYVNVRFDQGFHVITGETGAGKSMLIDALSLIAGSRASSDWVRYGEDKAEIECLFDLPEDHEARVLLSNWGMEHPQDQLVIRREITKQGKSISRINGQLVNLSMLKELGEKIINIHGQHEHQSLLKTERHIHLLDAYCGSELKKVKKVYSATYQSYIQLKKQLKELQQGNQQNLQLLDVYRFQMEEIKNADLKLNEDAWLMEKKQKLSSAEKLFRTSSDGYDELNGNNGALDRIRNVMFRIEEIKDVDKEILQPIYEQISSAFYQLEDAAFHLRDYRDNIAFQPEKLAEIQDRLHVIHSLKRKYGSSIQEILDHYEHIKKQCEQIEHKDEYIEKIEQKLTENEKKLEKLANELTLIRKQFAERLSLQVESHLKDLNMEKTRFSVSIHTKRGHFQSEGQDEVEFMISPNPGEPLRPLSKIASGGEMSRIMLSLKSVFAELDQVPVLIFDEVDTGVSGRAAQAIAEKMSMLSRNCQVFSITHLPQVACMADIHYEIFKDVDHERTFTKVVKLDEDQRILELARMLSGVEVTETTEHHAKEMLVMAAEKKQSWNHFQ